jgi:hypothetical protein
VKRDEEQARELFNRVWELMERATRTPEEDDEMIHAAHASRYHWGVVGKAENRARGEWQISRMYTVLGRGEPAVAHAERCLDECQQHGLLDWDLAYAYESLARAHKTVGHTAEARKLRKLARAAGDQIAEQEERDHFNDDYATL